MDFLSETALHAKVKAEPSLLEPREEFDLPPFIRKRLFMNQVMVLADLAQLTRETIEGLLGFTRKEKDILYTFMERKGIPARSSSRPVFYVFYTEAREEYDKILSHIGILLNGADEILEHSGGASREDALEQACLLYDEALRKAASYLLLIGKLAEAAEYFLSSADIVKAAEGVFSAEAGEDLESAAFCYEKMRMYPLALELYEQALNISFMNFGNANVHPKPIMYEISSIYYKMGDTGSALEWMNRYDSFPE